MIFINKKSSKKHNAIITHKDRANYDILRWSRSHEKELNVITIPYNSPIIFAGLSLNYIKEGKRILYISDEKESQMEIISYFKSYTNFRDYGANSFGSKKTKFNIVRNEDLDRVKEKYDLVIFNDINSFSKYDAAYINNALLKYKKPEGKIISFCVEGVLKGAREIILPVSEDKLPLCEPRIITTRLDLNKEIPYTAFQYIKWCIEARRKIIIYTASKEEGDFIFNYLHKVYENIKISIVKYFKEDTDERKLSRFLLEKQGILISNVYDRLCLRLRDVDIIVYGADNDAFNYKELIYFCSKVGRGEEDKWGEVIFLSNIYTEEMEKAKDIARNFNKDAWNNNLLYL